MEKRVVCYITYTVEHRLLRSLGGGGGGAGNNRGKSGFAVNRGFTVP